MAHSETRRLRLSDYSLIAAVILIDLVVLWAIWAALTNANQDLREHLSRWTVISLNISLISLMFGILLSARHALAALESMHFGTQLGLSLLLISAAALVTFVAPRTNRIYFDEHIYQTIGQAIAENGRAMMCDHCDAEGGGLRVDVQEYNKQPNAFPFYLSVFFRLFWTSEWIAHLANNVVYLLGIISVFGAALILFESELAGLFAALCYALTPMVILWSATVAAEPSAATFSAMAVFAAALYRKKPCFARALMFAGSLGIAVQSRPESIFILAPVGLLLIWSRPRQLLESGFYWLCGLSALVIAPEVLHLFAVRTERWGSSGEKLSLALVRDILPINGPFYYENLRFPALFAVLALIGLITGRPWKTKIPLFLWFLYSWGIFLFFYAGSYNYGADVRFSLISAPVIALFSGWGAAWLSKKQIPRLPSFVPAMAVLALIIGCWIKFIPLIRTIGPEASQARDDVDCFRKFTQLVPPNSLVFTHNPNMWLIWGKNAAQLSYLTTMKGEAQTRFLDRYPGGLYLHWNYWCNVSDPGQTQWCSNVLHDYDAELIDECKPADYRFALYRIKGLLKNACFWSRGTIRRS